MKRTYNIMKLYQFVILVFFMKILNFFETECIEVLVADPDVTSLDMLYKAKMYYEEAKTSLSIRKKEREKAMQDCSDGICPGDVIKELPDMCDGEEPDLSKCALKMFMKGRDISSFGTDDWTVTVILFYKYVLDGAYSFALCFHYYYQTDNAIFFQSIRNACLGVSHYFLQTAVLKSGSIINRIVTAHPRKIGGFKYLGKDYVNMSLDTFNQLFPKTDPSYKDKTIHAIKNIYEYERYIKLLLDDKLMRCGLIEEEDRLECILNRTDKVRKNIKSTFQNLEFYLNSIHCKSTLSLNPLFLSENRSLVLKTHKAVWESLNFITETLKTYSEDPYDQPIDLLIEIEKLKAAAVAKFNGKVLEEEPGLTEAADYKAYWSDGTSRDDFIWMRKTENQLPKL